MIMKFLSEINKTFGKIIYPSSESFFGLFLKKILKICKAEVLSLVYHFVENFKLLHKNV